MRRSSLWLAWQALRPGAGGSPFEPRRLAAWFARNPIWLAFQRLIMGAVLAGLAVRLAFEERRN